MKIMRSVDDSRFAMLKFAIRALCVLAFLTGAADIFSGTKLLVLAGSALSPASAADPILNSQIKFWGGIWTGYGVALWYVSSRIETDGNLFAILLGTLWLSGLGRALSAALYGVPGAVLSGAMLVELIAPPALWFLRRSLLRR